MAGFAPLLNNRTEAWDGNAARERIAKWASSDGSGDKDKVNWKKYGRAFMWAAPNASNFGDFKLPYCDVVDGDLQAIWKGVTTCAAVLVGSMGGAHIPAKDEAGCRAIAEHYYSQAKKMFKDDSISVPWASKNSREIAAFQERFGTFGEVETRVVPIVVRSKETGDPNAEFAIEGRASVFEQPSLDLGGFTEYIAPGAFTRVLTENPDVVATWDHDTRYVLARTTNKTLFLTQTDGGLDYWARVAPTSYAEDLRILLERGDVNQASFAFTVAQDEWRISHDEQGNEVVERTITEVGQLMDVCVTAFGAYPQTVSDIARSYFHDEAVKRMAPAETEPEPEVESVAEELAAATEELAAEIESLRVRKARIRARNFRLKHGITVEKRDDNAYVPKPYNRMDDENIQCPDCGKFNDEDAQNCDQCGVKLAGLFIVEQSDGCDGMYTPAPYMADPDECVQCQKCGLMNADDARCCDQCGANLVGMFIVDPADAMALAHGADDAVAADESA